MKNKQKAETYFIYILTLSSTNKKYIGRTKNPIQRMNQHENLLRNNLQPNIYLQNDYNKCPCKVVFEIVEDGIPISMGKKIEQLYMRMYDSYNIDKGYNVNDPWILGWEKYVFE